MTHPLRWLWWLPVVVACGSGETGDACFDDLQCSSLSCSWGSCDDPLLALLLDIASSSDDDSDFSDETFHGPPPPSCSHRDESTCSSTPGCWARTECYPDASCYMEFYDGTFNAACTGCLLSAGPCGDRCISRFECLPSYP